MAIIMPQRGNIQEDRPKLGKFLNRKTPGNGICPVDV